MPQSMQRAPCRLTSAGGSGRTNSFQFLSRASTFSYGRSLRSISRKPFTRPITDQLPLFVIPSAARDLSCGGSLAKARDDGHGPSLRRYSLRRRPLSRLQQHTLVVSRHHLDEAWQGALPVLEQLARPRAAGVQVMPRDQDAQPLGVEAQHVAHAVVLDVVRTLARPARI